MSLITEGITMQPKEHGSTLLDNKQAASYLGFSPSTLNNSRYNGLLGGVKAPRYRKVGTSIRYELSTLKSWLSQFKEQTSTSEDVA